MLILFHIFLITALDLTTLDIPSPPSKPRFLNNRWRTAFDDATNFVRSLLPYSLPEINITKLGIPTPPSNPRFLKNRWHTAFDDEPVDRSEPAPPLWIGNEVVDLLDGEHFDAILQDSTDDYRTASLIIFWNSFDDECSKQYEEHYYPYFRAHAKHLPKREELLLGLYDEGAAPKRSWYRFLPEQDLAKRFGVERCPQLVFVPRRCTGWTDWCVDEELRGGVQRIGCANFTEACEGWKLFDGEVEAPPDTAAGSVGSWLGLGGKKARPWIDWAHAQVKEDGLPERHTTRARDWIMPRQRRTETTFIRNAFMPPAGVRFTKKGFHTMPIPDEIYKMMTEYYEKWKHTIYDESWNAKVNTVINFHEVKTRMVSLDKDMSFRNKVAIQYFKPMMEQWSGLRLHFESFYGIREYYKGHWLRSHIDRLDTHVISCTMNLNPIDSEEHWPLEIITADGERYRYEHPPGWMVFYESTVVIHGRPFKFPDNLHRGAFIHFAPKEWKATVPSQMRQYQQPFTTREMPDGKRKSLASGVAWKENRKRVASSAADRLSDVDTSKPVNVWLHNFMSDPVSVFWVSQKGDLIPQGPIQPQEAMKQTTWHGHRFQVMDEEGKKMVMQIIVDARNDEYVISKKQEKNDL